MSLPQEMFVGTMFAPSESSLTLDLFPDQSQAWNQVNLRANHDGSRVLVEILDPQCLFEIEQSKIIEFYELRSGERFRLSGREFVYLQKYQTTTVSTKLLKKPVRERGTKRQWFLSGAVFILNLILLVAFMCLRAR